MFAASPAAGDVATEQNLFQANLFAGCMDQLRNSWFRGLKANEL